jgi:hypothetical protein
MSFSTKIGSFEFDSHIIENYIAYEPILAYSPVFICTTATNHQQLYVSQTTEFDNGNPLFAGIAQNDAVTGETLGLITSGLSTVRFYSNGFGRGENIYITNGITNPELLGTTCIPIEGNPVYLRNGSPIHVGRIIPTTFFSAGLTRFPYVKYAKAWIKSD